jgi:hypothetical protein
MMIAQNSEVWDMRTVNEVLKETYGEKVYRISLNAGCTCPNRDGTLGSRGCIFCSAGGSGDFAEDPALSITEQIEQGKRRLQRKVPKCRKFIAYFQAYTNTYAPVSYLRPLFLEALAHPDVVILSIATRPDCLGEDILSLLDECNKIKPVWVELGLQTIHERSAAFIRRGFSLDCYDRAVYALNALGICVITHVILGLPGETPEDMYATVDHISALPVSGVKLQLLHILKGTDLAVYYEAHPFPVFSMEEYIDVLMECLNRLPSDMVVHRMTGDGPKSLLIAPLWSADKKRVLNAIQRRI